MRIGLVCPYDLGKPGGVQQVVIELGRHLHDEGDEVLIVGPGDAPSEVGLPVESVGGSVGISANRSAVPIALNPGAWKSTLRALDQVDLVHIHEPLIPLVGWAALSLRHQRTVATFHANPPRWARNLYRGLAFLGEAGLDVTTTATSPVSAGAIPGRWGKPLIVPIAIDVGSYELDVERDPQQVAFLGRDDPRKGLSVLLEAWPLIRDSHPDARLEVMGADRSVSLPGVRFHGRASEQTKRQILASSGVYVAPNLSGEGFGVVIAEGMAAGCAVVASDLEAFRHVLGQAGVLTPAGAVPPLASEVTRLLDDPGEAERFGRIARNSVARFDWSAVVDGYREAYRLAGLGEAPGKR